MPEPRVLLGGLGIPDSPWWHEGFYPTGVQVTSGQMAALPISRRHVRDISTKRASACG